MTEPAVSVIPEVLDRLFLRHRLINGLFLEEVTIPVAHALSDLAVESSFLFVDFVLLCARLLLMVFLVGVFGVGLTRRVPAFCARIGIADPCVPIIWAGWLDNHLMAGCGLLG